MPSDPRIRVDFKIESNVDREPDDVIAAAGPMREVGERVLRARAERANNSPAEARAYELVLEIHDAYRSGGDPEPLRARLGWIEPPPADPLGRFTVYPGVTPLLDTIASMVRHAAEDPDALHDPPRWDGNLSYSSTMMRDADLRVYMINRLDELINWLNPAEETRETFAATLTMLGSHLIERRDLMTTLLPDAEGDDRKAYYFASQLVTRALGDIAKAIDALEPKAD